MYTKKDKFRHILEKYLQNHSIRETAFYTSLFLNNKIIDNRGLFELAIKLNLHLTAALPIDILARFFDDVWHVQLVKWHPEKLRYFECAQRIYLLLANEMKIMADMKEPYYNFKGFIRNEGDPLEFALELCLPTPDMMHYIKSNYSVEMISNFSAVDEKYVERRIAMGNLSIENMERITKEFEQTTNVKVKISYGTTFDWAEYKKNQYYDSPKISSQQN